MIITETQFQWQRVCQAIVYACVAKKVLKENENCFHDFKLTAKGLSFNSLLFCTSNVSHDWVHAIVSKVNLEKLL